MAGKVKERRLGVSEFKAHCLRLFDELERGGPPIAITKHGRRIALIKATSRSARRKKSGFGSCRGLIKIKGDIVHFDTTELWEALK